MTKTLVMKFGGTSVGSIPAIRQVIEIARAAKADWANVAIVVSAMGGVTDTLLNGVAASATDEMSAERAAEDLREKHFQALETLEQVDPYVPPADMSQFVGDHGF